MALTFRGESTAKRALEDKEAVQVRMFPRLIPIINEIYNNVILINCKGKEYGAWIDETVGGTARATTRTTAGALDATLISNPSGVIEDIARTAGVRTDQIDTVSFDNVYDSLGTAGYVYAGVINKQESWFTIASFLAWVARCWLVFDPTNNNKLKIIYNDPDPEFTVGASTTVPADGDIFADVQYVSNDGNDPDITNERYTQYPIIESTLSWTQTPKSEIFNEVYINYHVNYATGNHYRTSLVKSDNSDTGAGSRDQNAASPNNREAEALESQEELYGTTQNPFIQSATFDVSWVRNAATAVLIRNFIFDNHRKRRKILNFRTWFDVISNSSAQNVDIGDVVNIRHPHLQGVLGGKVNMEKQRWIVTKKDIFLTEREVDMEVIQVAD